MDDEMKPGYFPVAPLEAIARTKADLSDDAWNSEEFAEMVGVSSRAIARWRTAGNRLDWKVADRCAVALGLHPLNIWGDDWLRPDLGVMDGTDVRALALIEQALTSIGEQLRAGNTARELIAS